MKKLIALITAMAAVIPAVSAHSGLYHAYNGVSIGLLMVLLWFTLAVYEELGDTFMGHWVLFSGIYLAFYVPLFYPHHVIDLSGVSFGLSGVFLVGGMTFYWHHWMNAGE